MRDDPAATPDVQYVAGVVFGDNGHACIAGELPCNLRCQKALAIQMADGAIVDAVVDVSLIGVDVQDNSVAGRSV